MTIDWRDLYREIGKLGSGGQGHTVLVEDVAFPDSRYALKTLRDQRSRERRSRMHIEAATLRTLNHPQIARLIATNAERFESKDDLYIVTEYIQGSTLSGPLVRSASLEQKLNGILKLLDCIIYCHGNRVIHRDIKPQNVIARSDSVEDLVLIDFGLSFNEDLKPVDATFTGQQIGNRFIDLPELRNTESEKRNAVSDLTQLVGLFFYTLTGLAPESLSDERGLPPHKRQSALQALDEMPPGKRLHVERLFDVGFAHFLEARWQSGAELRAQFERLRDAGTEAVRLPLSERIKSLTESAEANPVLRRRETLNRLVNHAYAQLNSAFSHIPQATSHKIHLSFSQNKLDGPNGAFGVVIRLTHTLASQKPTQFELKAQATGDELLFNSAGGPGSCSFRVRIYDPTADAEIERWAEDVAHDTLKVLLDRVARPDV
jgi:serine/threonine protein kinase